MSEETLLNMPLNSRFFSKRVIWLLVLVSIVAGCGRFEARMLSGVVEPPPVDFSYLGDKYPCYLELAPGDEAIRVNCYEIDGVLHIHSSRWANLPRISGESWRDSIRKKPDVRIEIDESIYPMRAIPIDDEQLRQQMLRDRGYVYAWEGITIFRFEA